MSAQSIFGYGLLFFILLLLTAAHPVFILIFFIAIIAVIIHKINQRKKHKVNTVKTYPKNYSPPTSNDVTPKTSNEQTNSSPITSANNYARVIPDPNQNNDAFVDASSEQKSDQTEKYFERDDEVIKKNNFDRYYWNFRFDEPLMSKKQKFLEAIDICGKNNLGSKAKLRRLKMKLDRWSVENERDVEAMIPDYESLLDLIEEYENQ